MNLARAVATELMDEPDVDPAQLAGNFDDIERANAAFGGVAPVVNMILGAGARSVLDVGCGSGDIARALARRNVRVVGLDRSEAVLGLARARSAGVAGVSFERGDALALPYGDREFDAVTLNLALHHFEPAAAVAVLREMRRVARVRPIVSDLRRSRAASLTARAFAALIARNPLTKHDAPLSVRRAYTPREALELGRRAGWEPRVRPTPFFRMLVWDAA